MANYISGLDYSVSKGTSGILFITDEKTSEEQPCIKCGRCADACPMYLMPLKLAEFSKAKAWDEIKKWNLFD